MTMDDQSGPVPTGHGTIELTRAQNGYQDVLRRYTVLVDEAPVGRIRRGRTLRLTVPAGTHQLRLKIDWCTSAVRTAEVRAGAPSHFVCAPGAEQSAIAAVTSGASDYIALWPVPEAPAVPVSTRMDASTRFNLVLAFMFFGGGLTVIAAWIWQLTGLASGADQVVFGVGLVVTLASMAVVSVAGRRRRRSGR
jgi:hypothetical protein